jgi:RimJ/RimL family protein N-acetyltransferase
MRCDVTFEPLEYKHRSLLIHWTAQPHVRQWWSDATDNVDSFLEESDERWPYIASVDGVPVAYIQSWRPTRGSDYPWQHALSDDARGMDLFIGPPEKLNRRLGPLIVVAFSKKLFTEGASRIYIDPNTKNERAIRCYEKVGFRHLGEVHDIDGTSLLMELVA